MNYWGGGQVFLSKMLDLKLFLVLIKAFAK